MDSGHPKAVRKRDLLFAAVTTMPCPICGSEAEDLGSRDYGDKKRVNCPRCGPFEISRTALAMLDSRLAAEPNARARLSHSVRLEPKKDGVWLMVTSANLGELMSKSLPDLEHQLELLLTWLSVQLGDDPLGPIPFPNSDHLAGVVGAVNGERVDRLLAYAAKSELIEFLHGMETVALTPEGLRMIRSDDSRAPASSKKETEEATSRRQEGRATEGHDENCVVMANCNNCGGERKTFQRRIYMLRGDDERSPISWSNTFEILECCGCAGLSVRHTHWFSEWDDFDIDPITGEQIPVPGTLTRMWPPASGRSIPDWADRIKDEKLRTAMDEVYTALDHELVVLAAIGTRTLLDRGMFLRVGDPAGGFTGKLDAMVRAARMNDDEKNTFSIMVDVGSAAAHRGHAPSLETLNSVLTATESLLFREFIMPEDAKKVRDSVPPRRKGGHETREDEK